MKKEERSNTYHEIQWRIGGEAGAGIKVTGEIFAMACSRAGMFIADYSEYPSLIRGGHNVYHIRAANRRVFSHDNVVDILVALNRETIDVHKEVLRKGASVIYDLDQVIIDASEFEAQEIQLVGVPLLKLAKEVGTALMKNTVALGASYALLGCDSSVLTETIADQFKRKGTEVVQQNISAAQKGFEYVKKNAHVPDVCFLDRALLFDPQLVITGNEAIAAGAISGGCKFYAAYPMTPSTSLLHFMAEHDERFGVVVKHAEDEISVINMAIGASFAGVRSMIGTSGGGFALMNEAVSLAGMIETPLVIVVAMRPGPATGLPTWTAQGDLQFVIHSGHGEFPRIVIAPGDLQEAFEAGWRAHNYAEQFQIPVFIVTDKYLSESRWSTDPFPLNDVTVDRGKLLDEKALEGRTEYLRYELTDDGVSSRAIPGTPGGVHLANSDEHHPSGFVSETSEDRNMQNERRRRKLDAIRHRVPLPTVYGPDRAEVTLVVWGSQKAPALQAQQELEQDGVSVNVIHLQYMYPFPGEVVHDMLQRSQRVLLVENNATGQLKQLVNEHAHIDLAETLLKDDGRPVFASEIIQRVRELLK